MKMMKMNLEERQNGKDSDDDHDDGHDDPDDEHDDDLLHTQQRVYEDLY